MRETKETPVFFSDLDRTLIFSKKFQKEGIDSLLVEEKDGKPISYMTREGFSILQELKKNESIFIPVSTRTWETMTRVGFIKDSLPEWMICDNGAHIYHNGERLKEWEDHINKKRQEHTLTASQLEQTIRYMFEDKGLKDIINREDIYLMVKFEEMTGEVRQSLEVLNLSLRKKGYRMDINSRKAYLLPDYVRKEDAVEFLIKQQGWDFTISAGDSYMDLEMLRKTTHGFAPRHKSFTEDFMHVTHQKGMLAGEELLNAVQHLCRYVR
ncbi:HAD family hydrolase [Bacillus sp. M6-12]|uniref:HAD family hydrolase n=1 Tax=Bacillus sp. M6-12 TaxID=2054166 RepID=UPI0015E0B87B|nr:HAD-IIB family hydrolase [Bacillus sp. M6-12]